MSDVSTPQDKARPRRGKRTLRVVLIICAVIAAILVLGYVRLLFGPVSLNFLSDRVQSMVAGVVEDTFEVQWSDFGIALSGPASLAFHLSSVQLLETGSDAEIDMDALEIGISPLGAIFGQPDARVTLIGPRFQMVQDLAGPRLSRFEFMEVEGTGETVVRVLEGQTTNPLVRIGGDGLTFETPESRAAVLRSDNDWLIYNVEAMNETLSDLADQALAGQVVRVSMREGRVGILDPVYGLYKELTEVDLDIRSGREDGRVAAIFSAQIADRTMHGTVSRRDVNGMARIDAEVENLDFSTLIPFIDDAQGLAALRGAGNLGLSIGFDEADRVIGGSFSVDLSGTRLRLNTDHFPVQTEPFEVVWDPDTARFHFSDLGLTIGNSRATVAGDVVLGLDYQFGPTFAISARATDVWLHPDDLDAPEKPFDVFTFEGWSAPLYGALGVDRMVGVKDDVSLVISGRIDTVRDGVGLDMTVSGRGASADDLKRLWPHIFAPDVREWFTQYVSDGQVQSADMRFKFPVGTISTDGEPRRVPDGAMSIDLVGTDVDLQPFEGLPQFEVAGESRVSVRDNQFTMAFERATISDPSGDVQIANAAFLNQDTSAAEQVFEISGDISGTVPTLLQIANGEPLNLLDDFQFGVDLDEVARDVRGEVASTVIATIATDADGQMTGTDYALNGTVSGLRSTDPILGVSFADTSLSFTASQEGFRVVGNGEVQGIPLEMQATKSGDEEPDLVAGATLSVADAQEFGVDLSEFMQGDVRVMARPLADGRIQVTADLQQTALTIRDVGVTKAAGVPGTLNGILSFANDAISISEVDLGFGNVRLQGDLAFTMGGQLQTAEFSTFRISPGDNASVSMTPRDDGFALAVRGQQLDLKPVLKRFFNLEGDADAAPSEDLQDQTFAVSVQLDRALGYFGSVALNLDLDLEVRGDELRRVNLSSQLGGGRTMSAATNRIEGGRVISYASNDIGAVMRLVGVYPRLVGGEGSLVMRYDSATRADAGEFQIRNFAIVDEGNLDEIVSSDRAIQPVEGGGSALAFDFGRAQFVRYPDRIRVVEAALYGDTVGGTIRGNILTETGRYDLAGTYVPLFGLNNVFQQLPILGPIFGGREGEGLLGVTFAVRGPLSDPELLVNPVSILAPGVFRTLFEYRAQALQGQ